MVVNWDKMIERKENKLFILCVFLKIFYFLLWCVVVVVDIGFCCLFWCYGNINDDIKVRIYIEEELILIVI